MVLGIKSRNTNNFILEILSNMKDNPIIMDCSMTSKICLIFSKIANVVSH